MYYNDHINLVFVFIYFGIILVYSVLVGLRGKVFLYFLFPVCTKSKSFYDYLDFR